MISVPKTLVLAILVLQPLLLCSQSNSTVTISRSSGGPIKTPLSATIILNKNSSLQREWITAHDPALPVDFTGNVGTRTIYEDRAYNYKADFTVNMKQAVSAIEVRFLIFNVWGDHVKNLSMTEIEDYGVGLHPLVGAWRILSENEAEEHYASIAYIAKVRTPDGKVLIADIAPILQEAKKFSKKFTEADLESTK